ncbi:hypothetical protein AAFF_G00124560 [Aldrovandia affinis]|uniref:Ribonuclease A-domain domain-containing protein n=1 Tax=Aldrovandia affinis TaxID=143900 RepID=A0AAD7RRI1_9TELE|nr:hypothetical protein AAFF_G00124560 [Aldrovandia affinis]
MGVAVKKTFAVLLIAAIAYTVTADFWQMHQRKRMERTDCANVMKGVSHLNAKCKAVNSFIIAPNKTVTGICDKKNRVKGDLYQSNEPLRVVKCKRISRVPCQYGLDQSGLAYVRVFCHLGQPWHYEGEHF